MPRYIDTEELLKVPNVRNVCEYDETGEFISYKAVPVDAIENTHTVDAVEVVRCKDCVHAGAFPNKYAERRFEGGMNCFLCRGDDGYGIANVSVVYPDDFCSDGVRRGENV